MTIHNKVIDHLNHVTAISVGISGTHVNNQEYISDSLNHSPTNLLITAMSGCGWGWDLNHKLFSLGGNVLQNPNPANAHMLRVQSVPQSPPIQF